MKKPSLRRNNATRARPEFAALPERFFCFGKEDLLQAINTLRKLSQMEWQQVYKDKGLNWEYIDAREVYTLRTSQKIRISALRQGNIMQLLAIHPDHDSAYE